MLQANNRLTKKRDFDLVLKHGRWVNGAFVDLKYVELAKFQNYFPKKEDPDNFKKQLKLAVVVGVKISKSAVIRNRLKRQMREVVRLNIKNGSLSSGFFVMLVARPHMKEKNYAEISEEINLLLKKAKIYFAVKAD